MDEEKDATVMDIRITERLNQVFKTYLIGAEEHLVTFYQEFLDTLRKTQSIIAGGSIVSVITNTNPRKALKKINDLDIYTYKHGAQELTTLLLKHGVISEVFEMNVAPSYDESFLRANNIKIRLHFKLDSNIKRSIDIMIVDDDISLPGVVNNFDLTFCQVYFDGDNIKAFFPEHIINRSGYLTEQYVKSLLRFNKFTIKRMKKYTDRGFEIKYNIPPDLCSQNFDIRKNRVPVSLEEWLVKKIYSNLKSYVSITEFVDDFILLKFDMESLLNLLKKAIKEKYSIPAWLLCLFNSNPEKLLKVFLIYILGNQMDPFKLKNQLYRDYASDFVKTLFPEIDNTKKFESYSDYLLRKRVAFQRSNKLRQEYYTIIKDIGFINKELEKDRSQFVKLRGNTRRLENLNHFVTPSRPNRKVYPEKQLIEDEKTGNCFDIYTFGLNNINAYLKGEKVEAFTMEGVRPDEDEVEDYDLPPVPPEEARRRLVFFVEQPDGNYKPICYNLDMIEKSDLMSNLYSTGCGANGSMANVIPALNDPIFRLNLGEFSVNVFLKKLLGALYNTKKQVFILRRTEPAIVFPRTASLSAIFGDPGSWVSADHCQEGSDKTVYEILECEEKDGNLCYPILESNNIDEVDPDEFKDMGPMNQPRYYKIKDKIFGSQRKLRQLETRKSEILNSGVDLNLDCTDNYVYNEDDDLGGYDDDDQGGDDDDDEDDDEDHDEHDEEDHDEHDDEDHDEHDEDEHDDEDHDEHDEDEDEEENEDENEDEDRNRYVPQIIFFPPPPPVGSDDRVNLRIPIQGPQISLPANFDEENAYDSEEEAQAPRIVPRYDEEDEDDEEEEEDE
jgi:hypothetical protein